LFVESECFQKEDLNSINNSYILFKKAFIFHRQDWFKDYVKNEIFQDPYNAIQKTHVACIKKK
jgi:hypothetical protein